MTCYNIKEVAKSEAKLTYLPYKFQLKNGLKVKLCSYNKDKHEDQLFVIFKRIIEEGNSYPQSSCDTIDVFRGYFVSHNTFVCVIDQSESDKVIGSFFVKPNWPGWSSHICNGGFIVAPEYRGLGVGSYLAQFFDYVARDLGYEAYYLNLVYDTNEASKAVFRKKGAREVGRVPGAGYLKGHSQAVDAVQFYSNFKDLGDSLENLDKFFNK